MLEMEVSLVREVMQVIWIREGNAGNAGEYV